MNQRRPNLALNLFFFFTYGCRRRNPVRGIGSLEALVQAVLEAGLRPKTTAILCDVGIQEVTQKIENMG